MVNVTWQFRRRLLLVLLAVLLLIEILDLYIGWRVLLVGLGLAWLIAFFWSRSLARGLRLKRELRFGWLQVGDRMLERLTITNSSKFPALWVELYDRSTLPNHRHSRTLSVGRVDSVRWFRETTCSQRGLFTLGPITIRTGDPFGFYAVELDYPTGVPVLVLPQIVPLPATKLATGGRAGEGTVKQKALERTVSAASVREYMPGDYHRWIHWPTTARRDDLFVRVFDAAPAGDLWIVLDMYAAAHLGEGMKSTEEYAVVLAASLADRGLRFGRAVGLASADDEIVWLPPRGGEVQRWQILQSLAQVSRGRYRLAHLLWHLADNLGREASILILTPDLNPEWIEPLASLKQMGASPTVFLLDRAGFGGQNDVQAVLPSLVDMEIAYELISRDLLDTTLSEIEYQRMPIVDLASDLTSGDAWKVVL